MPRRPGMRREVVVTGTGLVSCQGEGAAVHLAALAAGTRAPVEAEPRTGVLIHPAPPLDLDRQIPKRSEQRQMEGWQRLGVYGAGLALEAAGLRDDAALKARMQMIVSAGGGERDYAVDTAILSGLPESGDPQSAINTRLASDLRPTLFLAQLSNLLAGNIAIVHGVTGASRTFMGEEASGVDALRIAEARIASGQTDLMLVGGSINAERPDLVLIYDLGGFYWRGPETAVLERPASGGGFVFGGGAGFLVLEAADHAAARGAKALATLEPVTSCRGGRAPGDVRESVTRMLADSPPPLLLSGATGVAGPTEEEAEALSCLPATTRTVWLADFWGQMMEAQAPAAAALAAELVAAGEAEAVAATVIGHARGEGLIRLSRPR